MTMTAGETEIMDLSALEFTPEITCDWTGCNATPIGYVVCTVCTLSHEFECPAHRNRGLGLAFLKPDFKVNFTSSCRHTAVYLECPWVPVSA